ncbi:unnamed protein product [Arctogadus glacialis]
MDNGKECVHRQSWVAYMAFKGTVGDVVHLTYWTINSKQIHGKLRVVYVSGERHSRSTTCNHTCLSHERSWLQNQPTGQRLWMSRTEQEVNYWVNTYGSTCVLQSVFHQAQPQT